MGIKLESLALSNFYQIVWDIFIYGQYYSGLDKLDLEGLPDLLGLSKVPSYVFCISIDDYNYMTEDDRYRSKNSLKEAIAQILQGKEYSLIFAHQNCYYLNGHITEIQLGEESVENYSYILLNLARKIRGKVKEIKEISLTTGIDFCPYPSIQKWKEISQHAIVAQRRKFFEGKDRDYFFLSEGSNNSPSFSLLSKSYFEVQQKLLNAIITGDLKEAEELSVGLVEDIFKYNIGRLFYLRIRLIEAGILIVCNLIELGLPEPEIFQILTEFNEKINSLHDFINLAETFYSLTRNLTELAVKLDYKLNPIILKIKELVESSEDLSDLNLNKVSRMVNANYSYVSRLFKKELGVSFTEYINRERMKRAIPLIFDKQKSIEDIAINAGFRDMQHFERVFKNFYNCSPLHYRKNNL